MKRLTPTSDELAQQADIILDTVTKDDRRTWLDHPVTKAFFILLEEGRMSAFEAMENTSNAEELNKLRTQASYSSYLLTQMEEEVTNADLD